MRTSRSALKALCGLLAPATGVVLYATSNNAWPGAIVLGLFSVIVFSVGIASVGIDLATKNYVLDLAPADSERPVYIGVNDTLVGLPTMLLVGVGLIVDVFGFVPLFGGDGLYRTGMAFDCRASRFFPQFSRPPE